MDCHTFMTLLEPDAPGAPAPALPGPAEVEAGFDDLVAAATGEDLTAAAALVGRRLVGARARSLRETDPDAFRRWTLIAERLGREADRVDDVGIRRLLDSYDGKPRRLLDTLAGSDGPVVQGTLAAQLGLSADYMSKVATRLEQADLLLRWRDGKRKTLQLTPRGRRWAAVAAAVPETVTQVELVVTRWTPASDRALALAGGSFGSNW